MWTLALLPVAILLLEQCQSFTGRAHLMFDLVAMVLPLTLALTLLSDSIPLLLTLCLGVIITAVVLKTVMLSDGAVANDAASSATPATTCCSDVTSDTSLITSASLDDKTKHLSSSSKLQFITLFRGGNLLLTCISILAVDFHTYPRRFGKTELYGVSLMDTGAGESRAIY